MPPSPIVAVLGITSLLATLLFYVASSDIAQRLSPQGCRMSWMSPSYVLQNKFDTSWTPLARRYSLWLYREVGWDPEQVDHLANSLPVIFIPGNAGSSHQVRSIASSATRQFWLSPYTVDATFKSRPLKPLDFFAVEFNEDLSAFHGPTLESQIAYTTSAVRYILSLYPPNTTIIIMGHSMGGIVATSLLPSPDISAIITMSTPHTLPPARFDSRMDRIYEKLQGILANDPTPILSLCGGATDMMIPSEACILPSHNSSTFRSTIFTSALAGAWTGVGHREMVWCHQVRWRVARAALELGGSDNAVGRAAIFAKWLDDGRFVPSIPTQRLKLDAEDSANKETLPLGERLVLRNPHRTKTYLLPTPQGKQHTLTVFVSQGSMYGVSPQNPLPLQVSIFTCVSRSADLDCTTLRPTTLKLIPNPIPGRTFPAPDEGSDESEGVALYEVGLSPSEDSSSSRWISVLVENGDGNGWVIAGLDKGITLSNPVGLSSLLFGVETLTFPVNEALRTSVTFPNLLSNALVAYRITPLWSNRSECLDSLFPPLIIHTSNPTETHYFTLANQRDPRVTLHTHLPAPYITPPQFLVRGVNFTVYSSGDSVCNEDFKGITISVDWSATLGRWGSRYMTTLVSWAVGVAALVVFFAWGVGDSGLPIPNVSQSLTDYGGSMLRLLLLPSFLFSFLPLPESLYLGNKGEAAFSPLAPLVLVIASGLVCVSWWILSFLVFVVSKFGSYFPDRGGAYASVRRSTLVSMLLIFLLIFLFVPWQVAFLGSWILHLHTCASSAATIKSLPDSSAAIPFIRRSDDRPQQNEEHTGENRSQRLPLDEQKNMHHHNMLILLLMTWLLPLAAPALAVWVRTLATAGLTTPFDGDHNFLNAAPFLVMVDFASWTRGPLFQRQRFEDHISVRWSFAAISAVAFSIGSRQPYSVFDASRIAIGLVVAVRIGKRYWGGASWNAASYQMPRLR